MTNAGIQSLRQHWQKLSGCVHPDDEPVFARYPGHTFNLAFPPPAFIGDIDHAPIVILMANGGYKSGVTEAEFPNETAISAFRAWLRGEFLGLPTELGAYYRKGLIGRWVSDGIAVLVNAIPYRSPQLSKEPVNQQVARELASYAASQNWLQGELLPAARSGERFVFVHRNGWWNVAQSEACPTIVFSDRRGESNRSRPDRDRLACAEAWLESGAVAKRIPLQTKELNMTGTRSADPDDRVFTFVRRVSDTEKRPGTAGYDRYALIREGMTVREFLRLEFGNNPPRRVDIRYNQVPRTNQTSPNLELSDPGIPQAKKLRARYLGFCAAIEGDDSTTPPAACDPLLGETMVPKTITTASLREVNPADLKREDIDIRDIAHALAMICRFGGHCEKRYSVAEHSVLVSRLCPPEFAFEALLHDATEAYLGDIPTPLKRQLSAYQEFEKKAYAVIAAVFGLPTDESTAVKDADKLAFIIEYDQLIQPRYDAPVDAWPVRCLSPEAAKAGFLARFEELRPDR